MYLRFNPRRVFNFFVGSNESTSGLGVGFGGASEPDNAAQQRGVE